MTTPQRPSKAELEARLEELKMEYDLATQGLQKAKMTIMAFMVSALIFALVTAWRPQSGFTGTHFVILGVVLIFAYVIYFAFVFGRAAKLKAEMTEKRKLIEMTAGDKIR